MLIHLLVTVIAGESYLVLSALFMINCWTAQVSGEEE